MCSLLPTALRTPSGTQQLSLQAPLKAEISQTRAYGGCTNISVGASSAERKREVRRGKETKGVEGYYV